MLNTVLNVKPVFLRRFCSYKSISNVLKASQIGEEISIQGWVKSVRKQKNVTFCDINDGSTVKHLQVVLQDKSNIKITVGSSVQAFGTVCKSPKGVNEIEAKNITVIGECDIEKGYPFAPRKQYAPEYIREYLHLRPKTKKFSSVLRVRHGATLAFHNYLDRNGYVCVQTPILTSNDCEGAGEVFKVVPDNNNLLKSMAKENVNIEDAYFDKKSFLTVSGQLHLETAAHALKQVYCFGPAFRAENSQSRHHLSEFYMLELEKAFLTSLDNLLEITEDLIKGVTKHLLDRYTDDIYVCTENKHNFSWVDKKFKVLTYFEAADIVTNKLSKPLKYKGAFSKEHELALTEYFENIPVFVINWPKLEKPFYMKEIEDSNIGRFFKSR
ncbi:probable asparagine--tRNA ligase, mitochondrial isoform X2 [Sitophilus oryzae]|uniref:Probable asparagine--tRNA ligase, mitochondrial isoform X2 n=1 Tax=Sitophilus oryzae TaxID=7048 RepID=A0A6J2Y4W6_SITOR|nr:probable asparagine--tRNA ligase, mitochondrial isoform X2 [Sitophilus oryzae]